MFLIQGASNVGVTTSRGPQWIGMLHGTPPLEQRVICSGIVAQKASLLLRPLRGVMGEGLEEMLSSPKRDSCA